MGHLCGSTCKRKTGQSCQPCRRLGKARLIDFTPFSRAEFRWAKANMDNPDLTPLRRALAFHVVVEQAVVHSDRTSGGWGRKITPTVGSVARIRAANIAAIAERLRDVHLECQDACSLLERMKGCDYAVIYADPPYRTADISAYPVSDLDLERCAGLLAAQRGAGSAGLAPGYTAGIAPANYWGG